MPDEPALRALARAALKGGSLPPRREDQMWGGPARGTSACAVCGRSIEKEQNELEIQFNRGPRRVEVHFLHPRCHAAWEFERTKLGQLP